MLRHKWGLLACAVALAGAGIAKAGEQKELGLVDTSIGVKPTSAKNKLALITDPVLVGGEPLDYIPVEGMLNSHFDPSEYSLVTDAGTGTYSLGATAMGILPFQVVGFEVQTIDGGLVNVQDNGSGGDTITDITTGKAPNGDPTGPVGGGETGNVFDIHFKIINDEQSMALTSDQDQNFYELFLNQIGNNPNTIESAFVTPDSFVTFNPTETGEGMGLTPGTVTFSNIVGSVTPEVSSAGFLAIGGLTLFLRRRRAKKQSQALVSLESSPQSPPQSSPPPDHA